MFSSCENVVITSFSKQKMFVQNYWIQNFWTDLRPFVNSVFLSKDFSCEHRLERKWIYMLRKGKQVIRCQWFPFQETNFFATHGAQAVISVQFWDFYFHTPEWSILLQNRWINFVPNLRYQRTHSPLLWEFGALLSRFSAKSWLSSWNILFLTLSAFLIWLSVQFWLGKPVKSLKICIYCKCFGHWVVYNGKSWCPLDIVRWNYTTSSVFCIETCTQRQKAMQSWDLRVGLVQKASREGSEFQKANVVDDNQYSCGETYPDKQLGFQVTTDCCDMSLHSCTENYQPCLAMPICLSTELSFIFRMQTFSLCIRFYQKWIMVSVYCLISGSC